MRRSCLLDFPLLRRHYALSLRSDRYALRSKMSHLSSDGTATFSPRLGKDMLSKRTEREKVSTFLEP
jgi:hypothetical protein